ncbi:MAG: DAK2 domain-containing protein [Clostridia bacterium]|nr:DAK2 domain-containing protein [Clostridia bacterium]
MITKIDGQIFTALMESGIKYLDKHREMLNELNVFPVPDGDTGTNMVMTLRCGFDAIRKTDAPLSEVAGQFSSSVVYGARGNSGVIISQFIKGFCECLGNTSEADVVLFSKAVENGCRLAYASVAKPVEGTMLTVLREASATLNNSLPLESIDEAIDVFLKEARLSLARTPELLPILKKANVVDSGASGVVCFFEGMSKYLKGESIDTQGENEKVERIDPTLFNRHTKFIYGYCVEGLIQLTIEPRNFDYNGLKKDLCAIGKSLVLSLERDKIKLHIHVQSLSRLMEICQRVGEFLTVKVENMTVQNMQNEAKKTKTQKYLYSSDRAVVDFAVIAVATNAEMQQKFFDMGADVVILSEIAPSSQEFIEAFKLAPAKKLLVFPNSSNSILSSMQAGSMYKDAKVAVLNSRSSSECYAALSVIDLDAEISDAIAQSNEVISNMYQLSVYKAIKSIKFGSNTISKGDFFALSGNKIIEVSRSIEEVSLNAVKKTLSMREFAVMTVFVGNRIAEEFADHLIGEIKKLDSDIEIARVITKEKNYDLSFFFE